MTDPGDDSLDELLELEAELGEPGRTTGTYDDGNVTGGTKVPAHEVPDGYPVEIETPEALRLDVETPDGTTVATYLEWPGDGSGGGQLRELLAALGREFEEFANVYGDRVALDGADGWHRIDVAATARLHGTEDSAVDRVTSEVTDAVSGASDLEYDAVHLALVALVVVGGLSFATVNTILEDIAIWFLFLAWPGIPAAIYYDLGRVKERVDWDTSPAGWIVGGLIPLVNVAVGIAYLVDRHVRVRELSYAEAAQAWQKALIASVLMPIAAFPLEALSTGLAASLFFYGLLLAPLAVYLDAEYVEELTEWDPFEEAWALLALVVPVFGAGAYLLRRMGAMD